MIKNIFKSIRKVTNGMAILFFIIVVVLVFAQVLARYVFDTSIKWADEVSRFAFVWLVYIGGAATIREGINVCFDLILESATGIKRKVLFTFVNASSSLFLVLMTYFGVLVSKSMTTEVSSILGWPMSIVTLAVPIGGVVMLFEQINYYFEHINNSNIEEGGIE